MFLNPSRIQILDSIFLWVPVFIVTGATKFFSPIFTLSPPEASLLLSLLLSAITEQNHKKLIQSQTKNHKSKINPPRPPKHKQPWLPKPKLRNPLKPTALRRSKAHLFCCYGVTALPFFFFIVILRYGVPRPISSHFKSRAGGGGVEPVAYYQLQDGTVPPVPVVVSGVEASLFQSEAASVKIKNKI
jgi:hypothetical protein